MTLAELVYDVTEHFPPRERFGLSQQMRKSGELATRRHLITEAEWSSLSASLGEVGRLTHGLLRSLRPPNPKSPIPNIPNP
jgi:hypothetical protein